jgi:Fe/S biogenesis protein NfuA
MDAMTNEAQNDTVLSITPDARVKVLEVRAAEPEPDSLALWLEVSGEQAGSYTYDLYFQSAAEAAGDDLVVPFDELQLVIKAESVDKVRGATLDFTANGMVMQNPNRPAPAAPPVIEVKGDLAGEVAQKVQQVLADQINPAIASHGGHATLMGVDGSIAYITMGGGCQGCAMSQMTLRQGIVGERGDEPLDVGRGARPADRHPQRVIRVDAHRLQHR